MDAAHEDLADFTVNELAKRGASYAEARLEIYKGTGFLVKNGIVDAAAFDTVQGIGIRYILDGTLGFFDTNILEKDKIKQLLDSSLKTTKKSVKIGDKTLLSRENAFQKKYKVEQKIKLANIDPDEKLEFMLDLDKALLDLKIDIPTRYFSYEDEVMEKYYVNSEGSKILAEIPRVDLFYIFTIKEKNETIQKHWQYGNTGGFEFVKNWKLEDTLIREAKALYKNIKEGKKTPSGKMDVIVAPEVTGIMTHESIGHPYEADRILGREGAQAGESFVTAGMVGSQIGSEMVTAVDDPTIPNSFGYFLFDDEGVPAKRKFLMKEGRINELLHNRETSASLGMKNNGSSRAKVYDVEAIVRMSNTFVLPGDWKEDEIIKDTKHGIYLKNFMEWNIDDVRLNQRYVGNEAYLVENGEIKYPIKRPTIEITTPVLWKAVDAISNKIEYHAATCGKGEPMQGIPVWMGGPTMRLSKIAIK